MNNNFQYRKLCPLQFIKNTSAEKHNFLVSNPWHQPYKYALDVSGSIIEIDPIANCEIIINGSLFHLGVSLSTYPRLAEAVLSIGSMQLSGGKIEKFRMLYRSYECIEEKPNILYASIRHSLAHAPSTLTRPNTINTLKAHFGAVAINLDIRQHERIFYKAFCELLVENDLKLHEILSSLCSSLVLPSSYKRLLNNWEVTIAQEK